MSPLPHRGEIWLADLQPTRGHEQARAHPVLVISTDTFNHQPTRGHEQARAHPVLVISTDTFNHGPADLVFVLPVIHMDRRIPIHVPIEPPEGGVATRSYIVCEALRSMAKERLGSRALGRVSAVTLHIVVENLRLLLALPGAQGHRQGLGP
jgi:mRNA interferase MazF